MNTISRSPGIAIGHGQYVVGGGYEGATNEIDQVVQSAAEALSTAYPRDITIRFNSDCQSGGAFLVTHSVDRIGANAEIGICADYRPEDMEAAETIWETVEDRHERGRLLDGLARCLCVYAHIGNTSLRDKSTANDWVENLDRCYAHVEVGTVAAAISYLREHAVPRESYEKGRKR